ncbi:50S ribosomal protein L4 [Culicoidibacter larvae]|uniref:Large ribosomal subunit protein uL4 n=1 Tax=Culicoidibacter larvae TaxID=2579976 RepID=A0A5R8QHD0_9FIRM|nr:50S ribosomal protein L4 [Culicoidibacter larvae]TLG77418.1 50S ribosomal protein L4 [Culicoidibacter larvae]
MPKLTVYKQDGSKGKDITISDAVFGIEPHQQAMFDAIIMQRASLRQGTHKAKNRSEVRGGGRKPWRQKGTGRARQGSIRSPQWRGGGIVFGPTPRSYGFRINKKVYRLALRSMLSTKVLENKLVVVDSLSLDTPKTKAIIEMFSKFSANKPLIVANDVNENVALSVRNIENASLLSGHSTSVLDLANYDTIIMTVDTVKYFEEVLA